MNVFAPAIEYTEELMRRAMDRCDEKAPVSIGGFSVEKPEEVYIIEDPQSVVYTNPATSTVAMGQRYRGVYRVEFEVTMQIWAVRANLWGASKLVLSWFEAFAREVASDKTFGGTVTNAVPFISDTGTAARERQYISVLQGGVRVTCDVDPLK